MGSGHILVYAFDVLMDIYTACGWSERDAAKSILRNNLYGLDIDRRAYQLAYFAVMMKARQYNRRILSAENQPNLANFADVMHVDTSLLSGSLRKFAEQFQFADTYGSLMTVTKPAGLDEAVSAFLPTFGMQAEQLEMMMRVARILTQKYDVVCTNPPYMGGSGMNATLSTYVKKNFPDSKSDLFACFMERGFILAKQSGFTSMITMESWMFLSSFEKMRSKILSNKTIVNMVHMPYLGKGGTSLGINFGTDAAIIKNERVPNYKAQYEYTVYYETDEEGVPFVFPTINERWKTAKQENFSKIPGSPVAYWVSENFVRAFERGISIDSISDFTGSQHITANNDKYLRFHWEVNYCKIGVGNKWVYYAKGGDYRKWYGNIELVVDWSTGALQYYKNNSTSNLLAERYRFKEGITYTELTSSINTFRYLPPMCVFDKKGPSIVNVKYLWYCLGVLGTKIAPLYFALLNPTLSTQVRDVKNFPIILSESKKNKVEENVMENVELCKKDWDSFETSWDFEGHPLV